MWQGRATPPLAVGIRDPRGPIDRSFAALDLTDGAFSTSGDYERFFMKDRRRYHHILDPDLGSPRLAAEASPSSPRAPCWLMRSRRACSSSAPRSMELIERLPAVEGVIVSSSNEVFGLARIAGPSSPFGATCRRAMTSALCRTRLTSQSYRNLAIGSILRQVRSWRRTTGPHTMNQDAHDIHRRDRRVQRMLLA